MRILDLKINGDAVSVGAPDHWTLLEVLRYAASLTGSKQGCDKGDCGACTVLLDGRAVLSCLTLAAEAEGREVTSIEVLADGAGLDVVQQAFNAVGAMQCGFCQPGMILAARQLVNENVGATRDEIRAALASNLCRCTGNVKILDAVELACAREQEAEA